MDYIAGMAGQFSVEYRNGRDFVIPDPGSASYTLFDNAGMPIAGHTSIDIVTDANTTRSPLSFDAAVFAIGGSLRFEKRTLIVSYNTPFGPKVDRHQLRVVPLLNYSITPESVRAFIGINPHELPNEDVDLFQAYLKIENVITEATLSAALASGTIVEVNANNAILYQAVLDVLPSLRLRVAQKETDGVVSFDRISKLDFDKLEATVRGLLGDVLDDVGARVVENPILAVLSQPTDPVTGE
jgi:hypothetical protein